MSGPEIIPPSRWPAGISPAEPKDIPEPLRADAAANARGAFSRTLAAELEGRADVQASPFSTPSPSEDPASMRLVGAYSPLSHPRRAVDQVIRESLEKDLPSGPEKVPALVSPPTALGILEQIRRYKEDQLLANPGGDHYHTDREKDIIVRPGGPAGFFERIGKDLKDAGRNFLNLAENFFFGAEYKYRDAEGNIQTGRHQGLIGTARKFFRNLASGLSLGEYVQEGEPAPQGAWERAKHFFQKVFGEALLNNLVAGVPRAVGHMVKDGMLGVLNLLEVIPDATVGNLPEGERLVTETFDNAQVALSYALDILPYGDAWARVNSPGSTDGGAGFPILYNLGSPAKGLRDSHWARVLNTPFRKAIETVGSVLTSALTFFLPPPYFPKPTGTGEEMQPEKPLPPPPPLVAQKP